MVDFFHPVIALTDIVLKIAVAGLHIAGGNDHVLQNGNIGFLHYSLRLRQAAFPPDISMTKHL
jgi:hypothetical protein